MFYFSYLLYLSFKFFSSDTDDVKTAVLFLGVSFILSPVLVSLTETISTDTIYSMTTVTLLANLLFHDYTAAPSRYICFFVINQSLEIITETRILGEIKIENRRKIYFLWKKSTSILFCLWKLKWWICECKLKVQNWYSSQILVCYILQICIQNALNCTDFSLDFLYIPGGEGERGGSEGALVAG